MKKSFMYQNPTATLVMKATNWQQPKWELLNDYSLPCYSKPGPGTVLVRRGSAVDSPSGPKLDLVNQNLS